MKTEMISTISAPNHREPDFVSKSFTNGQQDKLMHATIFSLP